MALRDHTSYSEHKRTALRRLPDLNRTSVLAAMIILAYTLANFIILPEQYISAQVPGFFINFQINITSITSLLVAGLMATGSDWLLRDHPSLMGKSTFPFYILPALTAFVIGFPLNQLPYGLLWWIGLLVGTIIVVLVLIGEYIAVDIADQRQLIASAGLTAVSFTLLLVLLSSLRSEGIRLFFVIPITIFAAWLVSMRAMYLRLQGEWTIFEAAVVAFIVGQAASAFHYWSLTSISYGLVLMGLVYALTSFICGLIEERKFLNIILEPLIALILTWSIAFWIS